MGLNLISASGIKDSQTQMIKPITAPYHGGLADNQMDIGMINLVLK